MLALLLVILFFILIISIFVCMVKVFSNKTTLDYFDDYIKQEEYLHEYVRKQKKKKEKEDEE